MKKVNIVYDFDGTLTQFAVPRYLILEKCGYKNGTLNEKFLERLHEIKNELQCEPVEAFYKAFFRILSENNLKITEKEFLYGVEKIQYNNGLENYFTNITNWANKNDIQINQYIVTSGFKVFVENSKYSKYFKDVFGCTFKTCDGIITGIDYLLSTKEKINKLKTLQEDLSTKPDKTIYIGDGFTDYYAMKYIHNNGGKTIFVHQNENDLDTYYEINKENIVDYCEIADYSENTKLYNSIKEAIMF